MIDPLLSALTERHAPPPSSRFWFTIEGSVPAPTIREIQARVARHYGLTMADMTSRRRVGNTGLARQVGMYLAYRLTDHSHDFIAQRFKKSDHSVSIFACNKVHAAMRADAKFATEINRLEASFA